MIELLLITKYFILFIFDLDLFMSFFYSFLYS